MMQRTQQGFTLIELMIVVAVIGILSATALAAYDDYLAKSQVTEAMSLSALPKQALAEYHFTVGTWPTSNNGAGLPDPSSITGKYVSSVDVASGYIESQFKNSGVSGGIQGKLLRLSPVNNDGSISWVCHGNLPAKLLPRACQAL